MSNKAFEQKSNDIIKNEVLNYQGLEVLLKYEVNQHILT